MSNSWDDQLTLDATIGFAGHVQSGLNCCTIGDQDYVVYPLGASIVIRNLADKTQSFLQGHTGTVTAVAVSPDGRYCASGQTSSGSAAIRIWDLEAAIANSNGSQANELCAELKLHKRAVRCLAFSPDSKFLASAGGQDDNSLVIWDMGIESWADVTGTNGVACCGTPIGNQSVFSVIWANNKNGLGDYQIACAGKEFVKNFQFSETTKKFSGTSGMEGKLASSNSAKRQFVSLVFTPDDKQLVAGTKSGELFVFNNVYAGNVNEPQMSLSYIIPLANSKAGSDFAGGVQQIEIVDTPEHWNCQYSLLVGAGKGSLRMLKLSERGNKCSAVGNVGFTTKVMGGVFSISPQASAPGNYWVGTDQGNMYTMDLNADLNDDDEQQFYPILMTSAPVGRINAVCYPNDSALVITAGADIRIWNTQIRAELLRIQVAGGIDLMCTCIDITSDGKLIVSGWTDGTVRGFFPESGKLAFTRPDAHLAPVTTLKLYNNTVIDPYAAYEGGLSVFYMMTGGDEGRVRKWSVDYSNPETVNCKMLQSWKEHRKTVSSIKIMEDNKLAVSTSKDGSCIVWDLYNNARYSALSNNTQFESVCFHPDQSQFLTCGSDRKITYWDSLQTDQAIRVLQGSEEGSAGAAMTSMDVDSEGRYFVSGSQDKLVKFWDYDDGTAAKIGFGHSGSVTDVAIAPDRQRIISVGDEGAIMFWVFPSE